MKRTGGTVEVGEEERYQGKEKIEIDWLIFL